MHAFLVSSPPTKYPSGPDCLHLIGENSLGIADVRRVQTFLSRKPLQLPVNVVVIHQAEQLTPPAHHALLKTLEEPPGNSLIFLVTAFPDQLLPTILSRTQSADTPARRKIDTSTLQKSRDLINQLLHTGVGERIALIQDQNFNRDSALELLDHLEYLLHNNLDLDLDYNLICQTRKYLSANVNVRLAMDYFVLHLKSGFLQVDTSLKN
jgi:hypothetical protein